MLFNGVNFLTGQAFDLATLDRGRTATGLRRRLRPGPRGRQRAAGAARLAGRFRRLVQLQVSQRRARRGRRLFRPRAARPAISPAAPGRLVGQRSGDALPDAASEPEFVPQPGADGWQLSNPPILAMAPAAGVAGPVRRGRHAGPARQVRAADGYLPVPSGSGCRPGRFEVITPREPPRRGCQLSIAGPRAARELLRTLAASRRACAISASRTSSASRRCRCTTPFMRCGGSRRFCKA